MILVLQMNGKKARGDRAIGLAAKEYPLVHKHFNYDITIDTSNNDLDSSCRLIMNALEKYNRKRVKQKVNVYYAY